MILIEYPDIDGTSTIKDHDKWHQLISLAWGVHRNIPTQTGSAMDRTSDTVQSENVVITRLMDSSSAKWFEAVGGTGGKEVKIHFLAGAGKEAPTHSEWTLENTLVASYDCSGGTDDTMETIMLNFTKIEVKSIEKGADDAVASPYPVVLDLKTGVYG